MSVNCCPTGTDVDDRCPRCHEKGRTVKTVTIHALVPDPPRAADGWRFCRSGTCGVAYYRPSGQTIPVSALGVRVGQKETRADRPVCYCFGYTAQDIAEDPAGVSQDIKARCRRGENRCAQTNPQGSCCLGNVNAVVRSARAPGGQPTRSTSCANA